MVYEQPERTVEYEGVYRRTVWVPDSSGKYRGMEYFQSLDGADRARLTAAIELQSNSKIGIRDKTKFRNEGDGIWAFKRYQNRLFCFIDGRDVCITHGIRKKQDRLPPKEIKIAKAIRDHNLP